MKKFSVDEVVDTLAKAYATELTRDDDILHMMKTGTRLSPFELTSAFNLRYGECLAVLSFDNKRTTS